MKITKEQGVLIRAVAILMIVVYHFQYDVFGGTLLMQRDQGFLAWVSNAGPGVFVAACFIGVNIFFVLSGYGLVKKFMEKKKVHIKDMLKQSLKILIPYWIAHPLIHLIDWAIKNLQYVSGVIDYKTYFLGMHSFSEYVQSALVFPRWFSEQGALIFDGTWWYIGIIIQFYLLFPILLWLFKKFKPLKALIICVGLSFIYRFIISITSGASPVGMNEADIYLFIMFPARLSEFALGMYLAFELKAIKIKFKTPISIALIVLGFVFMGKIQTMFMSDFLFALGGIGLLYSITKLLKGYAQKVFYFIGQKSYSIYLYHEPTLKLILDFIFPH